MSRGWTKDSCQYSNKHYYQHRRDSHFFRVTKCHAGKEAFQYHIYVGLYTCWLF